MSWNLRHTYLEPIIILSRVHVAQDSNLVAMCCMRHTVCPCYVCCRWETRFESLLPRFQAYCSTLKDFKKNSLKQ
jgi:hypothetical protein